MNKLMFLITTLALASCATTTPFTQEVREEYKLTEEELKSLQFYLSHNLVLKRGEAGSREKATDAGALKIRSGNTVEEVIIRAGTPGVVERVVDGNRLAVSFEAGDNTYLVFGEAKMHGGIYTLQASEWTEGRGTVNYGDKLYYSNTGSSNIYLKFKLKKLHQYRKDQKVVKGRKL